ncbi:MAG: hypothetical protein MUC88_26790 [Planctomycetes bacterium]|jgi:hypothetical protein|nr:hypothetical protein [Planctomycetota bacterium]
MIENIRNQQITSAMGMNLPAHADAMSKPAVDGLDATLQVNFADLISRAIQGSETETDAVQKARQLLQSGQLTSPENIRSAAVNIVTFGI